MPNDDLTLPVLIEIRDQIRGTNDRVDDLNKRVDRLTERVESGLRDVGARVEAVREELGQRIVHSEIRQATAITELTGTMRDVYDLVKDRLELRDRVEQCERDIAELKRRGKPE